MRAANGDFYVAEMGHDSRTQAARSSRWAGLTRLVGAVVIVASGLTFSAPPAAAQTPAASARPVVSVDLGAAGFTPSTVIAVPGQQIEFTNTSGAEQRIIGGSTTAPTFDSGPIPDGGRFVAAFDKGVQIGIQTTADPPLTGRLLITEPGLLGDRAAPARPAVPNLPPPPTLASDLSPHPDYGRPTSRTRLLVLPTATATIGQVNDAVAAVDGSIVAGMPLLHTIEVAIADTGDFTAWLAVLASLRAAPGIQDVAPEWEVGFDVRPAPTNLGTPNDGLWSTPPSDVVPGQWGLRAIRAAQAWNSLPTARESAIDRQTQIDTVVLDTAFGAHPDIEFASRRGGPGHQPCNGRCRDHRRIVRQCSRHRPHRRRRRRRPTVEAARRRVLVHGDRHADRSGREASRHGRRCLRLVQRRVQREAPGRTVPASRGDQRQLRHGDLRRRSHHRLGHGGRDASVQSGYERRSLRRSRRFAGVLADQPGRVPT